MPDTGTIDVVRPADRVAGAAVTGAAHPGGHVVRPAAPAWSCSEPDCFWCTGPETD